MTLMAVVVAAAVVAAPHFVSPSVLSQSSVLSLLQPNVTSPVLPCYPLYLLLVITKQKHPGCKKSAKPIRSSIVNRYVRPKTLISVEAKKSLIKNLFNYLNDIQ